MSVYLVPTSNGRYALYYEANDGETEQEDERPRGFLRRWFEDLRTHVKEAELEIAGVRAQPGPSSASGLLRGARWLRRRWFRLMAVFGSEQRLLWQLRQRATSRLLHPDDLGSDRAHDVMPVSYTHHTLPTILLV